MKLNKGTILKASCDYIRQLQNDRDLMLKQQQEVSELKEALQFYGKRVKVFFYISSFFMISTHFLL